MDRLAWLPVVVLLALALWQAVVDLWCLLWGCLTIGHLSATAVILACLVTVAYIATTRDG